MRSETEQLTMPPHQVQEDPSAQKWPPMKGNMAWTGSELRQEDFLWHLAPEEMQEIEFAVSDFKELELNVADVDRRSFPLPGLGKKLLSRCQDVHNGTGVFVLRGFNPKEYTAEDNLLMFLGISSYIGEDRAKQDSRGNMVVHVHHDTRRYPIDGTGPTKYSNKFTAFHSDNYTDIVALNVRDVAATGGGFKVASSWNVYNKLRASRPDLVEALAGNWTFDRQGGLFPQVDRPILYLHHGRVLTDFSRNPVTGTQWNGPDGTAVSRLSQVQTEALKEVEAVAGRDQVMLHLQPGDMVFLNNHAVLHSREAFWDDDAHSRHLVRLWLKNPSLAWELPPALDKCNRRIFYENETAERWPVKPSMAGKSDGTKGGDKTPPDGSH